MPTIDELQRATDDAQISKRSDGTLIYRIGPDRWADERTLKSLLSKLVGMMECHAKKQRAATGKEMPTLRDELIDIQCRLMNYQTGLRKLAERKLS